VVLVPIFMLSLYFATQVPAQTFPLIIWGDRGCGGAHYAEAASISGARCQPFEKWKGITSFTITDIFPRSCTIKVIKSGYRKWAETVTVYFDETTHVCVTLQEELGSIHITSNPSGAKCYLDGSYEGTTPLTITDISPGIHEIALKKGNYYDWEGSVNVSAGETLNIHATLEMQVGSIHVDASAGGAYIYIDGDYKGTTPLHIDNIPVGSHTILVSVDKYYDYSETITVNANETVYVEAKLEEKPPTTPPPPIPTQSIADLVYPILVIGLIAAIVVAKIAIMKGKPAGKIKEKPGGFSRD